MNYQTLMEAISDSTKTEQLITVFKNRFFVYRDRLGSITLKDFNGGLCYTFALALHKFLKSQDVHSELFALNGNLTKEQAYFSSSDHTEKQDFHVFVRVAKFYYDIGGRLGDKRMIKSSWGSFRNKKIELRSTGDLIDLNSQRNEILKKNGYDMEDHTSMVNNLVTVFEEIWKDLI